jgi:hypothetical protein
MLGTLARLQLWPSRLQAWRVRAHQLGARLADVDPRAYNPDRWRATGGNVVGELLDGLDLQRRRHLCRRVLRLGRTPLCGLLSPANDHHEQLVGAHQRHRRPCTHRGTNRAMPETVGDVRRQRGRDANAEQPPRQRRHPYAPPD